MENEYLIPAGEAESKIVIKNSRFIGRTAFTPTVQNAKDFIRKVKKENPGHSHAVYGYIIGYGNSVTFGMSDAGEPPGTAGRPVLEVVKRSGIGDFTLVVIRYFGGTKLGKGGLVRAYTQSAQETLKVLKKIKKIKKIGLEITFAYEYYHSFMNIVTECNGQVLEKKFSTDVYCRIMVPEKKYTHFTTGVKNACSGHVEIREVKKESIL